jgi:hypothetical protein
MPAPTASLVFQWKPNVTQSNFNCGGNGDTVAGEEVHVVLYVVYDQDSGVTHNYTKWQEVAGHSNQYAERLNIAGAPPDPNNPCAPTPGPNQLVVAFDWWDVYPTRFHNGDYEVRASYSYTPAGGSTVTPPDVVINVTFNDALLSIVTPPSPPYFLWNPADPTNSKVTVSFSVSDAQTFPGMTAVLKVYPLERAAGTPPFRTQTMPVNVPTTIPIDFTWDGKDEAGNVMPKGIYVYDLRIDDMAGMGSDVDDKVSAFLSLANPVDPETGLPIYEATYVGFDEYADAYDFNVSYILKDTEAVSASSGKIEVYDPDLLLVHTQDLDVDDLTVSAQGIEQTVTLAVPTTVMGKDGVYAFVISCIDNHASQEKGHRLKPALQVNNKAPSHNFVVSTDPDGGGQSVHHGKQKGSRDSKKFYVVIRATLDLKTGQKALKDIKFLLLRKKTGKKVSLTGYLITDANDPEGDGPKDLGDGKIRYTYRTHKSSAVEGIKDWIITAEQGKWEIKVAPPHTSNTVVFKIDKRKQIQIVADEWVGCPASDFPTPTKTCNKFVGYVYHYLGLKLNPATPNTVYKDCPTQDAKVGSITFYGIIGSGGNFFCQHVAINIGSGQIDDLNCPYKPSEVNTHAEDEPSLKTKWPLAPRHQATQELIDLDAE